MTHKNNKRNKIGMRGFLSLLQEELPYVIVIIILSVMAGWYCSARVVKKHAKKELIKQRIEYLKYQKVLGDEIDSLANQSKRKDDTIDMLFDYAIQQESILKKNIATLEKQLKKEKDEKTRRIDTANINDNLELFRRNFPESGEGY